MRYTVVWTQVALDELALLWIAAVDRNGVTGAAAQVDQILGRDPQQHGEEFYGDRLLIVPPLSVVFAIDDGDRIVLVLTVW